ncbi:MAG: DinB family protein [Sediminicola sp.]|tara:strand:+ start:62041 stop:62556 length:516 start_codon:yes stop_codon:yes gene_type:complete
MRITELNTNEYQPFHQTYLSTLGEIDLMEGLRQGKEDFISFVKAIPTDRLLHAYAEGKWNILEVLVHVLDTERIFQYRALRFYRQDPTPLPGFDQDIYVPFSEAENRTKEGIIEEYGHIRDSTISLFRSFREGALLRTGMASGGIVSVGAIGFIISGHQQHHLNILQQRYL